MLKQIIQVKPTNDFQVYSYFSDGEVRLYNVAPLIKAGGVFTILSDIEVFKSKCTVMNGTLAWDIAGNFDEYNCIDVDPESVYLKGLKVKDPLLDDAA